TQGEALALVLAFFVHVLDGRFVDHQVGRAAPVNLDAIAVVPLDETVNLLAVPENHHHRRLPLHLLLIVEIFGVGSFRRRYFLAAATGGAFGTVATFHGGLGVIMVVVVFGTCQ